MKFKTTLLLLVAALSIQFSYAQDNTTIQQKQITPFIAYELGEAAFNNFQSLSGEIGIKFANNHLLRLTHMNVKLTESHLSTGFAGAVDGNDVEGKFFGFEAFYDFPVFLRGLYISPSLGFYKNEYSHLTLNEKLTNNSATIGLGIGYRETNLFRIKGLYFMVTFPMRTPLNPIDKTILGNTTVNSNVFSNNIWLFIGYEF